MQTRDCQSLHVKHRIPDIICREIMVVSALALARRKFDRVLEPTTNKSDTVVWAIRL